MRLFHHFSILTAGLVAVLALGFVSCSNGDDNPEVKQKALVAIMKTDNDYWQQIAAAFSEECNAKGYTPLVYFAADEMNIQAQLKTVRNLETQNYEIKGIAIAPIWSETDHSVEQAAAEYASDHNIPIVLLDSPIDTGTSPLEGLYVSYVGSDNVNAGKELAAKTNAMADAILVVGKEGNSPADQRFEGIKSVKGNSVTLWQTNITDVKDIAEHITGNTTDIIFLNGHLCSAVLNEIGIYNVYTFDLFNEYAPLLDEETFLKGVMVQNTIAMGRQCVLDLLEAPADSTHYIPTIYLDYDNVKSPSADAKSMLDFIQEHSPFKGKSVLLALGTETYSYWQQIGVGAREKAQELNVDLHTVYAREDTDYETAANAINGCASISNLLGVGGQIIKQNIDAACANIPEGVNLTLIEGIGYPGGVSENRYNGIVSLNNDHYAKAFLDKIPEQKLLVLGYSSGNNKILADAMIAQRGAANVRSIGLADAANIVDSLQTVELSAFDAVILNTGNFVTAGSMNLLADKTVYSSDLNENVAGYIRTGAIKLNISPDLFKFGRLVLLSTVTGASYEVPFMFTDKNNVDSDERKKYY